MTDDAASIRVATLNDLDTVVTLMEELVAELGPPELACRLRARLRPDLHRALQSPAVRVFLAAIGGEIVGLSRGDVLSLDPIFRLRDDQRCGYIDQMYVRAGFRHAGLGKQLLGCCEAWFREQGIGHALLHAAPRAARFYAREGYLPNREMFKKLM
ncbi:MAG: GNAT family N-acetyltransferase [Deltaproteobacteria bacterium]|nr:GNAT family N-acetyltransferase [Deltaproteobacteria bacterium]